MGYNSLNSKSSEVSLRADLMVLLLTSIVSPDESTVIAKFGSYKESATLLMIRQPTASSVISASLANIECYF